MAASCIVAALAFIIGVRLLSFPLRFLAQRAAQSGNKLVEQLLLSTIWPLRGLLLFVGTIGMVQLLAFYFPMVRVVDTHLREFSSTISVALLVWLGWVAIGATEKHLVDKNESRPAKEKYNITTITALTKLLRIVLLLVGVLSFLQSIGANIAGIIAAGGVGGIAIGFAARDLLANFFGGLLLYIERPFRVGEWIYVPSQKLEGTVEHIGFRMTRIRTFDQRPLFIPNAIFTNVAVENPSRMTNRRIYETVGIRYQDALVIEKIVTQIKQNLIDMPEIDTKRTLMVNFNTFAPSSLDFMVYCFTKTTDWATYHDIKQRVLLMIVDVVDTHDASIAFPTSTIHIQQDKS